MVARDVSASTTKEKALYFPKSQMDSFMIAKIPFTFLGELKQDEAQKTQTKRSRHQLTLSKLERDNLDSFQLYLTPDVKKVADASGREVVVERSWKDELNECTINIKKALINIWASKWHILHQKRIAFLEFYSCLFLFFSLFLFLTTIMSENDNPSLQKIRQRFINFGIVPDSDSGELPITTIAFQLTVSSTFMILMYILIDVLLPG